GWRLGAVSADLATDNDARRLERAGIPARAITTGQACHLDAELVHRSLHDFPWRETEVFFIENVGNLVCPAIYDLGQAANVVVLSVAEGEDKPQKYPVMFKAADLVLLTKCDLLPHLEVDPARIEDSLRRVMPRPALVRLSARTGDGLSRWVEWLAARRAALPRPSGTPRPHDHGHAHGHGDAPHHGHGDPHHHGHAHDGGQAHDHPHRAEPGDSHTRGGHQR
ncbi:MAG TPA: hydrogenase nickel incorporation protein HypB, partial [Anaeromyxobacteraceae bacterium]|nr:hydrogenase nickel incorporation protein HypB [Anaeromyxobacteraceae bacterium]